MPVPSPAKPASQPATTTSSSGQTVTCATRPPADNAPCSNGNAVNNPDEVVGNIADCHGDQLAAVLRSHGQGYDPNALIAPSAVHLTSAQYINDQSEILGEGVLPNGDQRVFLLIPNPSVPLPAVPAGREDSAC